MAAQKQTKKPRPARKRRDAKKAAAPPEETDTHSGESRRVSSNGRRDSFPVVALGASAGGLEAFKAFFAHMPPDNGMGFVVISHLDPNQPSALKSLLTAYTSMPVVEATNDLKVRPNSVYIIPPNAALGIQGGRLKVSRPTQPRGRRTPVDFFFNSLAEDQGENAVAIVLSGTGSDGALGLNAVKEHGGLTMSQNGGGAKYDSMPRHALATGLIDFSLPVEAMPQQLLDYTRHLIKVDETKGIDGIRDEVANNRLKICLLIRHRTGHDFSNYKESTFIRRVLRRMQVLQLDSAARFVERLRRDHGQVDLLFQELLIGVTQFFRDPKAFQILETKIIPEILNARPNNQPVRVWVAGCATGEEAYSFAILFHEAVGRRPNNAKVQIFATDIDMQALEIARIGFYPQNAVREISQGRLKRYFRREGDAYRVVNELREMCIFSMHNLIKDPPFSNLDLVSCRNVLIYLNAELQKRVIPLLHFGLNPSGFLFLGPSENITEHAKMFARVDPRYRFFRRRAAGMIPLPEFPHPAPGAKSKVKAPEKREPQSEDEIQVSAERQIQQVAPAYVVIDDHGDVLRFGGPTSRYLEHATGTASLNLFTLVNKGLRAEIRALVHQAIAGNRRVEQDALVMAAGGAVYDIYVVIEPLRVDERSTRCWLVMFQTLGPPRSANQKPRALRPRDRQRREHLDTLEAELQSTRERLQTTIEELETSNEELKSSNEEFQSLNEELQSANEELETSKEELQSVNEELETVNTELNSKVESLDRANNDLKNLLENTQIATVFLGDDLRIKSFTPAITDVFNLIETDIGRPITDISGRLKYGDLARGVRRVQRTLSPVEQEVMLVDGGACYLMRILPYRTVANVIDGVVITFVDITERKRGEEERALLAAIVKSSQDAIIVTEPDGKVLSWNHGAEQMYGYPASRMTGRPIFDLAPADQAAEWKQAVRRVQRGETLPTFELTRRRSDGAHIVASVNLASVRDTGGRGVAISAIERDITEAKRAQERQRLLLGELDHRVKNTLAIVGSIVTHTLAAEQDPKDFAEAIEGRLKAMAHSHRLLSQNQWRGTPLHQLLREQIVPYRGRKLRNVELEGPSVTLDPGAALTVSLAIHELASNAAKYGSLSAAEGRLLVKWRVEVADGEDRLMLDWVESGGPTVREPARRGFGSELIERALSYELGGAVALTFASEGVRCHIALPLGPREIPSPS